MTTRTTTTTGKSLGCAVSCVGAVSFTLMDNIVIGGMLRAEEEDGTIAQNMGGIP